MANVEVQKAQERLDEAFAAFERDHPEVVEAMRVMNISFAEYLQALSSLKEGSSTSGNAAATPVP